MLDVAYRSIANDYIFLCTVILFSRLTFKRVIKEASVGEFSCLPYILALLSALTWSWYGFPVVSNGWENLSLFGTCAIGVIFEMSFIIIYIWYAPREKKVGKT
jgi:solute carrier family 50 protein (sugar transporter)